MNSGPTTLGWTNGRIQLIGANLFADMFIKFKREK
jgi:hypothetical protein